MRKKIKNLIIVVFLFLVANGISFYITEANKVSRIDTILSKHSQTIKTYYEILQYNQRTTANIAYDQVLSNDKFISLFNEANIAKNSREQEKIDIVRKKAQRHLTPIYNILKKRGVLQYHFVFPDNRVFLRMHKPSKFGDDLSNVRSDFKHVNDNKKIVRGFAQGRTAHAFRNVYPVIDRKTNKHLGAVEISFSSDLLQNYFTKINKIHTHFLVNKDIFNSKAWTRDDLILKYNKSAEHKDYMITMTDQHTKNKCIISNSKKLEPVSEQIDIMINRNEKFSIYTPFKGTNQVVSFFPIKHNITKKPVAWIVSYNFEPSIDKAIANTLYVRVFAFIVFVLLFGFIYFIINQKEILNEMVEEKTKNLSDINRELEESEHELQLINENLEEKIQNQVQKNRDKDKMIYEQTKMAALGEMIGNIAHQWRQPLSAISSSISGMQLQKEYGILSDEQFNSNCEMINENAQYLSKTIDNFRDFINGKNVREKFNIKEMIFSFVSLIETSSKSDHIKLITKLETDEVMCGLRNELNQSLINLFNNAHDALMKVDYVKFIFIEQKVEGSNIVINFKDNAGGIPEDIIDKIFEPYFTTKHQAQGTGLGLHMTYKLIVEGMNGTITVNNEEYTYEGKDYKGAMFSIKIPFKAQC